MSQNPIWCSIPEEFISSPHGSQPFLFLDLQCLDMYCPSSSQSQSILDLLLTLKDVLLYILLSTAGGTSLFQYWGLPVVPSSTPRAGCSS